MMLLVFAFSSVGNEIFFGIGRSETLSGDPLEDGSPVGTFSFDARCCNCNTNECSIRKLRRPSQAWLNGGSRLQLRQTSLKRKWPGEATIVPRPSGRLCSRDSVHTDSSYSIPAPEADGLDRAGNVVMRLPGWKSNELQVRTRLLAAVRSRKHKSWQLFSTRIGADASRTYHSIK